MILLLSGKNIGDYYAVLRSNFLCHILIFVAWIRFSCVFLCPCFKVKDWVRYVHIQRLHLITDQSNLSEETDTISSEIWYNAAFVVSIFAAILYSTTQMFYFYHSAVQFIQLDSQIFTTRMPDCSVILCWRISLQPTTQIAYWQFR